MSAPSRARAGEVRIGTSGWHYEHWKGRFYPEGLPASRRLAHYASVFDTVELNNTFYRLPTPAAVDAWRETVPQGFRFAVKASRYLTHMKRLADPEQGLARFLPVVERLGPALGPILFQLPPRWGRDIARLERFLDTLPRGRRYAFELRDPSWFAPEVELALERAGAAFVVWELGGERSPIAVTSDLVYVRLHGPAARKYRGSYGERELAAWAGRVRDWRAQGLDVCVYFDNDERAYAPSNALALREHGF